jgi:hypothetical protein
VEDLAMFIARQTRFALGMDDFSVVVDDADDLELHVCTGGAD